VPILIPKHERRFTGFDDKIIALYARCMTVQGIQAFLLEQYGTQVSPEFMYPVLFFDALRVKIREDVVVRNMAVYLALGVAAEGARDILGAVDRKHRGRKILDRP